MTNTELTILDDLIDKGFTTRTLSILDGTYVFTIRNLFAHEQLTAEAIMKANDQNPLHTLHTYAFKLLEYALLSIEHKGKKLVFKTPEEAANYINSKPAALVEMIAKEHSKLEGDVTKLLQKDSLTENFSQTPSTEPEQK